MSADLLGIFARSPDPTIVVDREGRVVERNPAATQMTTDGVRAAIESVFATGQPASAEWGERNAGGVRVWYAASIVPVAEDRVIVTSREITTLKRSEERLRRSEQLMVDTQGVAHLGTWEWDVSEPTAVWSAELYRIYGLTPETYTPSYEAYLTKVHPDDRQRVIDATNRVFHEHVPYSHDERILLPDGSIRFLHTWAYPVLDQDGKLVKLVGVCQDVSDRLQAEEALQQLNAQLEHRVAERTQQLENALRDLETFNSMASHDLRAPLAIIQMVVDVIQHERELPPRLPPMLDRIRRAIGNMSRLLDGLLMLAQVDHGPLARAPLDITGACTEIIAELRSTDPDRVVEVRIEPGLSVDVDRILFRAALTNLLGNAWKYTTRSAAAMIEIGAVQRADGHALFIRDNGIGFDMVHHDQLFTPFTRLANATDFKGSGVGLATVRRIVERHGGRLRAEGALEQGATFFIQLPSEAWLPATIG